MDTRLAYLRGEGVEIVVHVNTLHKYRGVAKTLDLRRLTPVVGGPEFTDGWIKLQCSKCGGEGHPHEMLANLDGKPFHSYEHKKCPR